jgi:hypothetical protein
MGPGAQGLRRLNREERRAVSAQPTYRSYDMEIVGRKLREGGVVQGDGI